MTLKEWAKKWNVPIQPKLQIFTKDIPLDARWSLFHLTDFAVTSSASGPSYWLSPRSK